MKINNCTVKLNYIDPIRTIQINLASIEIRTGFEYQTFIPGNVRNFNYSDNSMFVADF